MKCGRCGGLCVQTHIGSLDGEACEGGMVMVMRCMNCSEQYDPLTMHNRNRQEAGERDVLKYQSSRLMHHKRTQHITAKRGGR